MDIKTLAAELRSRQGSDMASGSAVVLPLSQWNDSMLLAAISALLDAPNAGHLRGDLAGLGIGGRFFCGGCEWLVTDIGTRTLVAVKIDEKARLDTSWLDGPVYALAETAFDEEDIKGISMSAADGVQPEAGE